MQVLAGLFILVLTASFATAHPGKTDRYGGHRCLKECAEWNLYYGEYHLHDKNGRSVRVAAKKRRKRTRAVTAETPAVEPQRDVAAPQASAIAAAAVTGNEICISPFPGGLLALLFFWLVVRRRRTREQAQESRR